MISYFQNLKLNNIFTREVLKTGCVSSGEGSDFRICAHVVAHERSVVARRLVAGVVVESPAVAAEVAEALEIATEVRTSLTVAAVTHRVLQIRIDLNLKINYLLIPM